LRGNLLVIPLEGALLYVQPLYLQAQSNPLPELKRVIAASTSSVVMSDRLDTALAALAQGRSGEVLAASQPPPSQAAQGAPTQGQAPAGQAQTPAPASGGSTAELAAAARTHLRNAEAAAGRGDWSTYGSEMAALQQALDQLAGSAGP
jgi:uncharacterized membrane protein (UPF0182 family)